MSLEIISVLTNQKKRFALQMSQLQPKSSGSDISQEVEIDKYCIVIINREIWR